MTRRRRKHGFALAMVALAALLVPLAALVVVAAAVDAERTERRSQPPMSSAVRLHVRVEGAGPRQLLVLHGLTGASGYFANRPGTMTKDHRVLAPDLLGFGASPQPLDARYTAEQQVDVLLATLGEELSGRRTLIVAHSFGAVVALSLLQRRPELFSGAVLLSAPVFASREEGARWARKLGSMEAGMLDDSTFWRATCALHTLYRVPAAAAFAGLPEDVYLDGTRHNWTSLSRTLQQLVEADVTGLAHRAPRPLLFIHGDADHTAPTEQAVVLADAVGAQAVVLAGGHQVFLDDPERVWRLVRAFEQDLSEDPFVIR